MAALKNSGAFAGDKICRLFCKLALVLCCWMITQCALRPVPRDLATYYNRDIVNIVELEEMALNYYAGVTGDNYVTDNALKSSLETEVIPLYERFTELAGQIKPSTEPVQKLHSLYYQAADLRLQGFHTMIRALDAQDPGMMNQANVMLNRTEVLLNKWQADLGEMAAEYGLKLY